MLAGELHTADLHTAREGGCGAVGTQRAEASHTSSDFASTTCAKSLALVLKPLFLPDSITREGQCEGRSPSWAQASQVPGKFWTVDLSTQESHNTWVSRSQRRVRHPPASLLVLPAAPFLCKVLQGDALCDLPQAEAL